MLFLIHTAELLTNSNKRLETKELSPQDSGINYSLIKMLFKHHKSED